MADDRKGRRRKAGGKGKPATVLRDALDALDQIVKTKGVQSRLDLWVQERARGHLETLGKLAILDRKSRNELVNDAIIMYVDQRLNQGK